MSKNQVEKAKEIFLEPGYVCVPKKAARLCAVVSSGIVVTIWDRYQKNGGMAHYIYSKREKNKPSTAKYAAPAIVSLVNSFLDSGSLKENLEIQLFGGAVNPDAYGYVKGLSESNVKVGREILSKMGFSDAQADTGGRRGRKIIFHTHTGETVIARVEKVRSSDWYP